MEPETPVVEPVTEEVTEVQAEPTAAPVEEVDKHVPYDRFKEVNDQLKQYKDYVATIQQNQQQTDTLASGDLDAQAIANLATQQATQTINRQLEDERQWNAALKLHPQIAEDKDIARAVKGYRTAALLEDGELITYAEAANRFMKSMTKKVESAKQEGIQEAQVSETIQKRASITPPSNADVDNEREELRKLMSSADNKTAEKARRMYLEKYFGK